MKAKERLEEQIRQSFKDNTINVNGKDYISLDIFVDSIRDAIFSDALLGVTLKKVGPIIATDEELLMYISKDYENTEIIYDNNAYRALSKKVE